MIEVVIKVKRLKELKGVLEWIKQERIEKTHPNIKIRIAGKELRGMRTNTEEHPAKLETRKSVEIEGVTIDLPTHDIQQATEESK